MKASECLAKYGDVAARKASGVDWVAAYAPRPGLGRNETHPIEVMNLVGTQAWRSHSELLEGYDWQPLLTEQEWQARHPLAFPNPLQVQFGYGELSVTAYSDTEGGKRRGLLIQDTGQQHEVGSLVGDPAEQRHEPLPGEIYLDFATRESALVVMEQLARVVADFANDYELPLAPEGEAEPDAGPQIVSHEDGVVTFSEPIAAKFESLAGEVTPPWTRELRPDEEAENRRLAKELAAQTVDFFAKAIADVGANVWQPPTPSAVGERLTEPPEVGTPVVSFDPDGTVAIFKWDDIANRLSIKPTDRLYLWLSDIPQEPKEPEKSRPPEVGFAIRINHHLSHERWCYWSCNNEHGAGWKGDIDNETTFTAEELLHQLAVLLENHWLPRYCEIMTVDLPEPKEPERVEPPKWLNRESIIGAISAKGAGKWTRAFATQVDGPNESGNRGSVGVAFSCDAYPVTTWVSVFNARLITDDPAYPPSPELAALFAEEVK